MSILSMAKIIPRSIEYCAHNVDAAYFEDISLKYTKITSSKKKVVFFFDRYCLKSLYAAMHWRFDVSGNKSRVAFFAASLVLTALLTLIHCFHSHCPKF